MAFNKKEESLFDLEGFKATGDISYAAILRYNIFQIVMAKANLLPEVYTAMIDLLETILIPYFDKEYNNATEKIDTIKDKESKKIRPDSLSNEDQELDYAAYEAKLRLLMLLMDRKGLLLDKASSGDTELT